MLPQSLRSCLLLVSAAMVLGGSAPAFAQTVATDPVGFVTINLPANSDTYVSLPLRRNPEFVGVPSAVAGNKITLHNTTTLTPSQFVYSSPAQNKHYCLFVAAGTKAGAFYTIIGNDASSLMVDLAGDTLEGALALGAGGTQLQVIPYHTLATIFPSGQGVVASAGSEVANRRTQILIPDQQSVGTDLAASAIYYYNSDTTGVGAGWRKEGTPNQLANDDILFPDNFLIVRNPPGAATTLTMLGGVQMSSLQAPISTLAPNVDQDNPVAIPVATTLTLKQTNLFESGAFKGSPKLGAMYRQDQLLVFSNSEAQQDKSAAKIYYYLTGGATPGWRLNGDLNTVRDNDVVVDSNTALIVRKKGGQSVGTSFWKVKPPYVP